MKPNTVRTIAIAAALILTAIVAVAHLAGEESSRGPVGVVYTMTNDPNGNAVVAYDRHQDGTLVLSKAFSTGGLGTGSGLGSQGSLTLSDDGRWLFAVNAGSDDVSVFLVRSGGLTLVGKYASGGNRPISDGSVSPLDADGMTAHTGENTTPNDAAVSSDDRFLYVLTGHTAPSIRAFRVGADGTLSSVGSVALPAAHAGLAVR